MSIEGHSVDADRKMPNIYPKERLIDGMWATVELLEALCANDAETARNVLDECDAQSTAFTLATLVMVVTKQHPMTMDELVTDLRANLPVQGVTDGGRSKP